LILLPVAAAILLLIFLFVPVENSRLSDRDIHPDTVTVRFVLEAPRASKVSVVGDWNGWKPDENRLIDPDGDGVWELQIELRRGSEYRYQFIIDNEQWIPDPSSSLRIEDGFGGFNSILHI
jgi:1,4-alpha-glucan branching enzyme